jgi:SNF2 family DNA or RNA helicase
MSVIVDPNSGYLLYERGRIPAHIGDPLSKTHKIIDVGTYVGFPGTLDVLQALHAGGEGVDVPPPLALYGYDWPGRVKPFNIQIATANMLALNPLGYVLNEMRTGKTLSSLWAADFLMRLKPGLKCLVVSNLSTLRDVWQTAIVTHFLGRRTGVVVHASSEASRIKRLSADVDFYLVNHDALRMGVVMSGHRMKLGGLVGELARRDDIDIVIIDEASAFKDGTTMRSKAGRELIALRKTYRWPMTGSPCPQKPTDIHGLRRLVDPTYVEHFTHVQNLLMDPKPGSAWGWTPKPGAYEVAASLLKPAVRFRAIDCFDAPPQGIVKRRAELSAEQKIHLSKLKRDALTLVQSANGDVCHISAVNAGVLRTKSLQICAGAVYDDNGTPRHMNCEPRMAVLHEIIEEAAGDKIIIMAPFTSVLKMLYTKLGAHRSVFVDGSVKANNRTDLIHEFTTGSDKQFLIAQPEVLKFGLDLSAASIIVWFGPVDKTETWVQANQRICGPNQKKPTIVFCLVSHFIEDVVYDRLQNQESMQNVFLALLEKNGDK